MDYSDKTPQKICTFCKKVLSMDGSGTEYNEKSSQSAFMDMNITICPDCTFEKYPKFYGIRRTPNRGYSNNKKLVSKSLAFFNDMLHFKINWKHFF